MVRTGVANVDDLVLNGMSSNGGAGVDGVHMVHATAGGVLLDDPDTHGEVDDVLLVLIAEVS